MNEEIPAHLISTKRLIDTAYPNGLAGGEYLAVLKVLYPHMSDRNLADAVGVCSGYHSSVVYNDIAKVATMLESELPALDSVRGGLERAGLNDWMDED